MSVIDLISSDRPTGLDCNEHNFGEISVKDAMPSPEIVEILSSSPPPLLKSPTPLSTPRKCASSFASSPLFEFEKLRLERESLHFDSAEKKECPPLAETDCVKKNASPSRPNKRPKTGAGDLNSENSNEDVFQLTPSPPRAKPGLSKRKKVETDEANTADVNRFARNKTILTPVKEPAELIEQRKLRFKEPAASKASAKGGNSKSNSSKVAAASKASDRKVAGEKLVAHFHVDTSNWLESVEQGLGIIDINVKCKVVADKHVETAVPDWVKLLVTVQGNFDDVWDPELKVFVKTEPHRELMDTALVVISASFLDELGKSSIDERQACFADVERLATLLSGSENHMKIICFFPEIAVHFRKRVDKFNREMRRLVASGEAGSKCLSPPDEHFYTNLEAELQILNDIRAYYPKKTQDAAEMISNCIVDLGVSRYHLHMDETHDVAEAYVKSKSSVLDITIESLAKVQGLPPRIAAKLGSEIKNLGKIREALGSNESMRKSRLKRFGQGSWNSSLLSLLEDDNPDKII